MSYYQNIFVVINFNLSQSTKNTLTKEQWGILIAYN